MNEPGRAPGAGAEVNPAGNPVEPELVSPDMGTLVGGLIILGFGLWFGIRAWYMPLGTATSMGPGFFPFLLSGICVLLGAGLALQGFRGAAERVEIPWRPLVAISASVLVFAFGIRYLGLVPAVVGAVLVSSFADPELRPATALVLGIALAIFTWLVFSVGLGISMPAFETDLF